MKWLKPTTVAVWGTNALDDLGQQCGFRSNKYLCTHTGQRHMVLQGTAPGGMRLTLLAQPYPHKLVNLYANLITERFELVNSRNQSASFLARTHVSCG